MSINLLANEVWSDSDINNQVTAIIRQSCSAEDELKASRLARKQAPSKDDLAYIANIDQQIAKAIGVGNLLRSDNNLLKEVIAFEAGCPNISEAGLELYNLRKQNAQHSIYSDQGSPNEQDVPDSGSANGADYS